MKNRIYYSMQQIDNEYNIYISYDNKKTWKLLYVTDNSSEALMVLIQLSNQ